MSSEPTGVLLGVGVAGGATVFLAAPSPLNSARLRLVDCGDKTGVMFKKDASVGALYGVGGTGDAIGSRELDEGAEGRGAAPNCKREGVGSGVRLPSGSSRRIGCFSGKETSESAKHAKTGREMSSSSSHERNGRLKRPIASPQHINHEIICSKSRIK